MLENGHPALGRNAGFSPTNRFHQKQALVGAAEGAAEAEEMLRDVISR